MTIPEAIEEYKKNIIESESLNESLFTKEDKDEWILALHKRAERMTELYLENNKLLDYINEAILIVEGKEMDDTFEALYSLYQDGYDDAPLMMSILKRMEDYYKETNDYSKLIVAYSIHAYECHEYISRLDKSIPLNMELYKGILNLKNHYQEIENPRIRWNFFINYFNVIVAAESIPGLSIEEVFEYLHEAEEFYHSDLVQEIDKDNEDIVILFDQIEKGFLVYAEMYEDLGDSLKNEIFNRAYSFIDKKDFYKSDFLPFFAYNRCLFGKNEITKEELCHRFEIYFKPKIEKFFDQDLTDEKIVDAFDAIGLLLKCLRLKGEANVSYYYGIIKKFFRAVIEKTNVEKPTPYVNSVIVDFVVNSLPFESNKEEIEQSLFDHLVRKQPPTYIHSVMVMKIAEIIYNHMAKSLLPKMDNPLEFIQNSALLHDIGKAMLTDIINMQRRRLSDTEFQGIRNHPVYGERILMDSDLLKEYFDVIAGHHKWYDGTKGYPMDFDNTKSKYRIIIDLITISDCIDAATDRFGRNYKHPKSVKEVVEEFKIDKGTKYSPYFTELLEHDKDLIAELEVLTQYKRPEYMYLAYIKGKIGK